MPNLPPAVPGLLLAASAAVLTACSGAGGTGVLSAAPSVTANGQHYAFAQGTVPQSQWPAVCSLLSTDSAAAAIGTAVSTTTFHGRCFYTPGNDAFPLLTVTVLGLGNEQRSTYDSARDTNARYHPTAVRGLGQAAVVYDVTGSPTTNLDMLTSQGVFEIALRSPAGNVVGAGRTRLILTQVAQAIASEFTG